MIYQEEISDIGMINNITNFGYVNTSLDNALLLTAPFGGYF